jgi:hypothetical protein
MKVLKILSVTALIAELASTGLAAKYDDLAAKGYRWVTADGPYACVSKDDLRQIAKSHTTETELQMAKNQRAYYLLQGDIVKVVREDAAFRSVIDPGCWNSQGPLDPHQVSQQAPH